MFLQIEAAAQSAMAAGRDIEPKVWALTLLCLLIPLEPSQLGFALIGAVTYAVLQTLQVKPQRRPPAAGGAPPQYGGGDGGGSGSLAGPCAAQPRGGPVDGDGGRQHHPRRPIDGRRRPIDPLVSVKPEYRQPSSQPISAPTFRSTGWEGEIQELLGQISPTPEGDRVVKVLACRVKQTIRLLIPEANVAGFACGDLKRGTAFGVTVPEVDIVVSVSPNVLVARLQGRLAAGGINIAKLDMRKLQKSAIRACTDRLVANGGFKFRRSAFRGEEPKVTLLAPTSLGIFNEAIPINFSVNGITPLYNAALLKECGQRDPRAKKLILLVKRWAKDRGVCHAAKGHLSPYQWCLLSIYYLQVGVVGGGPLLPPLDDFEFSSGLMSSPGIVAKLLAAHENGCILNPNAMWTPAACGIPKKPVGMLFKEFLKFYTQDFNWRDEAVSVRLGKRGPPGPTLPLHIIVHEDGQTTEVGPSIEDPFLPTRNLGFCTTAASLARMHEELLRARDLCCAAGKEASLAELLEPWVPPERSDRAHDDEELVAEDLCATKGGDDAGAVPATAEKEEEDEADAGADAAPPPPPPAPPAAGREVPQKHLRTALGLHPYLSDASP